MELSLGLQVLLLGEYMHPPLFLFSNFESDLLQDDLSSLSQITSYSPALDVAMAGYHVALVISTQGRYASHCQFLDFEHNMQN